MNAKVISQLLLALLIGLTSVVGTLLLLSRGASARPMLAEASLSISKSASADHIQVGAQLVYTLTYRNTSTDTAAYGVVITDTLDPNVVYFAASPTPYGGMAQNAPYWTIGTLSESVSGEIVLTVTVNNLLSNGAILTNTATIDGDQIIPQSGQITTTVEAPRLELTKSGHPDPVTAGAPLTYTLAYSNTGDATATNVTITDVLDSNVTFASASLTPSAGISNTLYWTIDNLAPTASGQITVRVTVTSPLPDSTILTNTAVISSQQTTPLTVTETTSVLSHSDPVSVVLTPTSATITAGQSISYTLIATDTFGNDWDASLSGDYVITPGAGGVWTTNVYTSEKAGTWTVTGTVGTVFDTATLTVNPGSLDHIIVSPDSASINAGEVQTYTAEAFDAFDNSRGYVTADTDFSIVEPGHDGYWTGNVYTSGNHGDWTVRGVYTETSVTTDTASLTVLAPVLHLEKSDDPDPVEAGDYLTYTLTYSNTGNQTATTGLITDVLDPNVSYVTASPAPAGGLPNAPFWSDGITPNEISQITITVAVTRPLPNGTVLTNTAWLDADQTTPLSVTQKTTVQSRPVLTITKVGLPEPVTAGQNLVYTIIITNSGNENATTVTVTEHYDPNTSFVYASPSPDSGSENRVWTFETLAVDTSRQIDIVVEVTSPLPIGTILTNQVTLDSNQTMPITITEITSVTSASELTVSKVDVPDPVQAGENLVYFVTYQNFGTAAAAAVVITETYDSRVTFVSADPAPEDGTNNIWDIGDLSVGEGGTIIVTVRVNTPLPNGATLTNYATIDSAYTSPKTYTETTTVSSTPDLTLDITDRPDPVEAGDPLTYTLRYTNTGNADATQVVVTATFDANISYVTASLTPTGGMDNVRYWEIDDISGEGGYGEITIYTNVTLPLTNSTTLGLTAQLADAEGDLLETRAETLVTSAPILSLHKSDGVSTAYASDRLTYTLTYTNSGNENAYNVTITDTLPSYTEYKSCEIQDGSCQHVQPDKIVFHIPTIIAQTSRQAQLVVQVNDPLPAEARFLTNHARMTAPSLPAPIDVQDVDHIGTQPDLTIAADHTPALFSPGKVMTYTVTYGNVGRMDAENVIISTILPTGTVYAGCGAGCQGWHSSDGRIYTYEAGDLPAGDTGNTIVCAFAHPSSQAQIGVSEFNTPFTIAGDGGNGGDANPSDNTAYVYIGVPDLVVISFTAKTLPLEENTPVTFTITLMNQGTGWALNPDVQTGMAGFWVDVFIAPVASHPWERYSEKDIYAGVPALAPGAMYTLTLTHEGFSEQEIWQEIHGFHVKVDNHELHPYGLVPESDESNNLGVSIPAGASRLHYVYLPLVRRED